MLRSGDYKGPSKRFTAEHFYRIHTVIKWIVDGACILVKETTLTGNDDQPDEICLASSPNRLFTEPYQQNALHRKLE